MHLLYVLHRSHHHKPVRWRTQTINKALHEPNGSIRAAAGGTPDDGRMKARNMQGRDEKGEVETWYKALHLLVVLIVTVAFRDLTFLCCRYKSHFMTIKESLQPLTQNFHKWLLTLSPLFFLLWRCDPTRVIATSFTMFLDHTQRRTTFGRTPLNEWSARRRDLYLTTQNTHNRQTSMPPVGFEPTISAGERPLGLARKCTI